MLHGISADVLNTRFGYDALTFDIENAVQNVDGCVDCHAINAMDMLRSHLQGFNSAHQRILTSVSELVDDGLFESIPRAASKYHISLPDAEIIHASLLELTALKHWMARHPDEWLDLDADGLLSRVIVTVRRELYSIVQKRGT